MPTKGTQAVAIEVHPGEGEAPTLIEVVAVPEVEDIVYRLECVALFARSELAGKVRNVWIGEPEWKARRKAHVLKVKVYGDGRTQVDVVRAALGQVVAGVHLTVAADPAPPR
jgi:hypothetical protein